MRLSLPLLLTLAACSSQPGEKLDQPANEVAAHPSEALTVAEPSASPAPLDPPAAGQAYRLREPGAAGIDACAFAESFARYRCMDGERLVARFDPDNNRVTVSRGGKALATLRGERVASGIRYTAKGYELRGKGGAMTFTAPGQPPIACTVIR